MACERQSLGFELSSAFSRTRALASKRGVAMARGSRQQLPPRKAEAPQGLHSLTSKFFVLQKPPASATALPPPRSGGRRLPQPLGHRPAGNRFPRQRHQSLWERSQMLPLEVPF